MSESAPQPDSSNENTTGHENGQSGPSASERLKMHILQNKIEFGLWCTRLFTIFFTLNYFIPIFGNSINMYYKALMANAATSALRLHQRLPRVQLSREFLAMLFLEDSAHYLMFSLVFLYSGPITLVLLPVFLFALLHFSSYTLRFLDIIGIGSFGFARMAIGLVEIQSVNILRTIAFSEIFIFPVALVMFFSGRASLMLLFVYYRFLTLRYSSRRNPYTRNTFAELRLLTETFTQKPGCPEVVRNLALKLIAFISRLAPPMAPPAQ